LAICIGFVASVLSLLSQEVWPLLFSLVWLLISGWLGYGWIQKKRSFYYPFIVVNVGSLDV
jgi:hypothetical protein